MSNGQKVTIFDDDEKVATITKIGKNVYIFAKSARVWREMSKLVKRANPTNAAFMKRVLSFAHEYHYSTESVSF